MIDASFIAKSYLYAFANNTFKMKLILNLSLLLCGALTEAANILVVIPFTSTSHYKFLRPIGLELARRGHNVTVITAHAETNPPKNYHEVMVDDVKIWESVEGGRPNVFKMVDQSFEKFKEIILWNGGLFTTEITLKSKEVAELMAKEHKFDLVISELFYQEALYMFAHKYQAPLILMNTYGNCMRNNFIMRNPMQLATVVHEFGVVRHPKTFVGRLTNLYYAVYDLFWFYNWYLPKQQELANAYFKDLPQPVPSLEDLHRNVSLVLMNTHFSVDTAAAYYPNLVGIAGLHIKEFDKHLPKDLQKFLDEAKDGVVYVNFGSNVRSSELPPQKRDAFLNVFRGLKQRVLWKWEDPNLPGKPDNVEVRDWLPQKEILAHPNVKIFIAHGGLIGLQEAIYNKVPILGVPIYADQYNNLLQAQDDGYGIILEYHDINEETLGNAVKEMLNEKYKKNIELVSKRFMDRPMSALNTSMYWIEYVIRHKGANFMKNPALKLSWFAYAMLDVYAFIIVVAASAAGVLYKIISVILQTRAKGAKIKKH